MVVDAAAAGVVVVVVIVDVIVVVVVVCYRVGGHHVGDAKRGQLGTVMVQAVFVQRARRLGRHGGGATAWTYIGRKD